MCGGFPGHPHDGHVLGAQLDLPNNLLQNLGRSREQVIVDLGLRGADAGNPRAQGVHRTTYKSPSDPEKRRLKWRQASCDKP